MRLPAIVTIIIALYSSHLLASLSFGSTPEWLAHKSSLTFIGVPLHVSVTHLIGDRWLTTVQFRIDRLIKGPLSVGDVVTVTSIDSKGGTDQMDLDSAAKKKRAVLVLATIAEHTFPETDGLYIFLPHFWNRPVFYVDEPVKWIYAEAGNALRDYADVLKRIEAQSTKETDLIRRYWAGKIVERQIDAAWGSEAQKELYAGSAVIIQSIEYKEPEKDSSPSEKQGEQGAAANP